jgi:hypothetical protein
MKTKLEDTRIYEMRQRIKKLFESQASCLQTRAMKAHGANCSDPLTCMNDDCFVWQPDKIVSEPYQIKLRSTKV